MASIESVRDEEQINAWLEQMKKRNVYKLKSPAEGENDIFDTREAAANYISSKFGADLVKPTNKSACAEQTSQSFHSEEYAKYRGKHTQAKEIPNYNCEQFARTPPPQRLRGL